MKQGAGCRPGPTPCLSCRPRRATSPRSAVDRRADGAELLGGAAPEERDRQDADDGDEGDQEGVLDEAGATLALPELRPQVWRNVLLPVAQDFHALLLFTPAPTSRSCPLSGFPACEWMGLGDHFAGLPDRTFFRPWRPLAGKPPNVVVSCTSGRQGRPADAGREPGSGRDLHRALRGRLPV